MLTLNRNVCFLLIVAGFAGPAVAQTPTEAERVVELVNQERTSRGLPPLKYNPQLEAAALIHSTNMAERDFFAHCDLDNGDSPWVRIRAAGYDYNSAAENIAAGYATPEAVMDGWMNSSGHRGNILSTGLREIGVGYYYQSGDQGNVRRDSNGDCQADGTTGGPYRRYWTQNFGRRNDDYPVVIADESFESPTREVDLYLYGSDWAQEMRLHNEGEPWTGWQPFQTEVAWTLTSGAGMKTVTVELRQGATVRSSEDTIVYNPALAVSHTSWGALKARY